ncbi:hypothetical protein D3C72_1987490 [compost metagenome]
MSQSMPKASACGKLMTCPAAPLVSSLDSACASTVHWRSMEATDTHSLYPGSGLPSRRDSVSKSCTRFCMRLACCAIKDK